MLFCPNCNNILDIRKNPPKVATILPPMVEETPTTVSVSSDETETKEKNEEKNKDIIEELINKFIGDEEIKPMEVSELKPEEFYKHEKFKKLDKKTKNMIQNKLSALIKPTNETSSTAYHVCRNCFYSKQMEPGVLITSKVNIGTGTSYFNNDKLKNMIYSKILPYSRDYQCVNKDCVSYKDSSKREAVMYRASNNLQVWYICTACQNYWKGE